MAVTTMTPPATRPARARRTARPPGSRMTSPSGRVMRQVANGVLVLVALCFAVPLVWLLLAAFDPSATLSAEVPSEFTLDNFQAVLTPEISFIPLMNSLVLSGGCAIVTVVVAILAAYPLSR